MQNNKKLKIAIVAQSPDLGGAEEFSFNLANEWVKRGHLVWVISDGEKYLSLFKRIEAKTIKAPFTLDIIGNYKGLLKSLLILPRAFIFYTKVIKKLKKDGIDVIFATNFSDKIFITFIAKIYNIPIVWEEYSSLETVIKKNFYLPKIIYLISSKFAEKIVVPSLNTRNNLTKEFKSISSKLKIIQCGIKLAPLKLEKSKNSRNLVVGCVSRLTREKGQEYFIKSAPLILNKFPNTRFILVGDGPDKDYFKKEIDKLGLKNNFEVTGFVKDKSRYYKTFDVFVFPTIWDLEGFGLVAVEAMAYAVPIVASDLGPIPEVVENGKTGILVEPRSPGEIAKATIKLLGSKKLRSEMGLSGRKRVEKLYNISRISNEFIDVFRKTLEGHK